MSTVPHMGEKINKAEKRMAGHERGGLIQSPRASRRVASHRIRSWSMPWHTGSSRSAILWSGGGRRRRTTPLYVLIQERILAPAPGIRIDLLACSHPTCSSVQSFCAKQITIKKQSARPIHRGAWSICALLVQNLSSMRGKRWIEQDEQTKLLAFRDESHTVARSQGYQQGHQAPPHPLEQGQRRRGAHRPPTHHTGSVE
jgi:hypothetical protein